MRKQKTALIIGGTRGVGLEIARESVWRGMRTIVVGRSFRGMGSEMWGRCAYCEVDLSKPGASNRLLQERILGVPRADHVFWVAGAYLRGGLATTKEEDIDRVVTMHQTAMVKFLSRFHQERLARGNDPYTLTVIGSVSSFRLRTHESVYAMAKAGQAAFLRQFAPELAADLPGSRVLLANCARLATETGVRQVDHGGVRIDPADIAAVVWSILNEPVDTPYREINIFRSDKGFSIENGPEMPQVP